MINTDLLDLQTVLIEELPDEVDIEIVRKVDLFPRLDERLRARRWAVDDFDPDDELQLLNIDFLFVISYQKRRWVITPPTTIGKLMRLVPQKEGGSKFVTQTFHQVRTVIRGAVEGRLPWKSYYDLKMR